MRNDAPNCKTAFKTSKSITELDGVWIMIPSLKLKKGKWKLLGSSLTIASCCPFSVLATSLLTPIYCPGTRFNWNRITVLPLLPKSIVKYWVTAIFQSTLSHLGQNTYSDMLFTTTVQSPASFPVLKWLFLIGYVNFLFFFYRPCCQYRLKYPFWFPLF